MQEETYEEAIQNESHKDFNQSATFSAILTLENDGDFVQKVSENRRFDGSISVEIITKLYNASHFKVDAWAKGNVNFACLAANFSDSEGGFQDDNITLILKNVRCHGNLAYLPAQLPASDYKKVDQILNDLGGKWDRKLKAHRFLTDAEELIAGVLVNGRIEVPKANNFGYFPTPHQEADVLLAGIAEECSGTELFLEPEAGTGNLALKIAELVPMKNITCYELQQKNVDVLRSLGFNTQAVDFLEIKPKPFAHFVIMNPPFANLADADHVRHAYAFLRPGGKLRAIMSSGITFRQTKKAVAFRSWVEELGGTFFERPAGAFKASGTMVKTVHLHIQKPIDDTTEWSTSLEVRSATEEEMIQFWHLMNALIKADLIGFSL